MSSDESPRRPAEIINLNQRRKQAARKTREDQASTNRTRFGRTKVEKTRDSAEAAAIERMLDGAKLERKSDKPDED